MAKEPAWMFWRNLTKLVVIAIFLAACFFMLARVIGYGSPWLGLLLMFYFMALAKFAEPVFVLRLPRFLRAVQPSLPDDRLYRRLGVRGFGALLRNTPLRYLNDSVYCSAGKRSLAELQRQAESAEATHFWAAVLFIPYIVYVGAHGLVVEAILFVAVQIVFNVYPILHLRVVRARLSKLGLSVGSRKGIAKPSVDGPA